MPQYPIIKRRRKPAAQYVEPDQPAASSEKQLEITDDKKSQNPLSAAQPGPAGEISQTDKEQGVLGAERNKEESGAPRDVVTAPAPPVDPPPAAPAPKTAKPAAKPKKAAIPKTKKSNGRHNRH